ncbi:MAG: cytochrome c biogenesis protein [Anaerolineae bacterium]|nr:cytochrome c biogenesis protein [Anaerolineae bacterium]
MRLNNRTLGWLTLGMFMVALWMAFFVAPRAQAQSGGDVQRIFYFHVPSAWIGFGAWIVTAFYGVRYLRTRNPYYDRVAHASAEIGVMFIVLVLISGMLWARPVWNAWWTWQPKETISALQFLSYSAYLMLRSGVEDPQKRARFASVYGIVSVVMVPLNFMVSRVLQSLHPAVFGPSANSAESGFGVAPTMMIVILFCLAAFTMLYIYLMRERIALQERSDTLEERRAMLMNA